jgi:D-alanyl-lipoteichoic acid acyltransferase DltB (MBOAT superfamily)
MTFVSFEYLVLLLSVFAVYYLLPWRPRILFLLLANYVFYAYWEPWYAYIIGFTTLMDYAMALLIDATDDPRRRKLFLTLSIMGNLAMLGYFKYTNFAVDTLKTLLGSAVASIPHLEVVLPAGISFYTFQEMSYTIDVYRRRIKPTRDLTLFATYVSFFPQLVAGPIERAETLLTQLAEPRRFDFTRVLEGVGLIFIGLFKKLVLADRLTPFLYPKFRDPLSFDRYELLLSLVAMPVTLYLDFGAYTDIARGSARLLGVDLSRNFEYPFTSRSPGELWQRWHRTLTFWMRDYVFLPLSGRPLLSLLVPATLLGLWHGASWKFVLWGLGNGLALGAYILWRIHGPTASERKKGSPLAWLGTLVFWAWTLLLMALFFCPDFRTALLFWQRLFTAPWETTGDPSLLALVVFIVLFMAVQITGRHARWREAWDRVPEPVKGLAFAALFYVVLFGSVPTGQKFVYFQF